MQTMTFKPQTFTTKQKAELITLFSLTPAELAELKASLSK